MQTTVGALVLAEPALQRLAEQRVTFQTAYHLRKLLALVSAETRFFHEQRDALIVQYGTARDVAGTYDIASDQLPALNAQIDELGRVPVVIDQWLLTPALLESYTVSAADLMALGDLIAPETPDVSARPSLHAVGKTG